MSSTAASLQDSREGAAAPSPAALEADYLQRVRALVPHFAAAAAEEESARELAPALLTAMHQAGLFRMLLPRWLDGGGLDPLTYTRIVEEVAKHDASAAWCINQGSGCSMVVGNLDPVVARAVFGRADAVLAWGPHPGARARAVAGGYEVDYSGQFASGSRHATWLGAHCLIDEADGTPRRDANGRPEMRTMIYPKTSAAVSDVWHVMGLRGTGSDSFKLDGLFVPDDHTLLRDDLASRRDPDPRFRYGSNMVYASGFAHVALGIARSVLDAFLDLAQTKTPRDAKSTLRDNAVVQSEVAQCEAKWAAARAYLRNTIHDIWETVQTEPQATVDQRVTLRLSSTFAIHQAKEVVDTIYDAAGATAIFQSNAFERRFRDIHTVTQQMQGRKAHFESCGKFMLGVESSIAFM